MPDKITKEITLKAKVDLDNKIFENKIKNLQKSLNTTTKNFSKDFSDGIDRRTKRYRDAIKDITEKTKELNKLQKQYSNWKITIDTNSLKKQFKEVEDVRRIALGRKLSSNAEKAQDEANSEALAGKDYIEIAKSYLPQNIFKTTLGNFGKSFNNSINTKLQGINDVRSGYVGAKSKLEASMDKLPKNSKLRGVYQKQIVEYTKNIKGLDAYKSALSQGAGKVNTFLKTASSVGKIVGYLASPFTNLAKKIGDTINPVTQLSNAFDSFYNEVSKNVSNMLNGKTGLASYNMGTSLFTNSTARNTQLTYGLSSSQYYGVSTAANMLGIQSEEDYYYMNSSQREKFNELVTKYNSWYEDMESSGVLEDIQEMQLELEEFKIEISQEFLTWVAQNKDTIMTVLRVGLNLIKLIANSIIGILNFFGVSSDYSVGSASDSVNSSSTSSKTNNISITASYEINNTGESVTDSVGETLKNMAKSVVTEITNC